MAQLVGGWMARQRWYAGKGGVPRLRTVGDIPLDSPDPEALVHILLMADEADPRNSVYQVPVVERRGVPDGAAAHLIGPNGDRAVFDGPYDPVFAAAVLDAIRGNAHPTTAHPAPGEQITGSGVLTGEQSNTSIVVSTRDAGEVMVKVFRVVQHGRNPDAELQGALSSTGASYVPRFVGALDASWRDAGETLGEGHLAIAQEFLRGAEDAWLTARRSVDAGADFSHEAFQLGRATAALHATLAERLPTEPPSPETVSAITAMWTARLEAAIRDVPSLVEHKDEIQTAYATAATSDWPRLQRIHGDLHLGQILHATVPGGSIQGGSVRGDTVRGDAADRWVFIDFEGEPLRTIEERTRPEPPLRDLAGMLRSFDYAAASSTHPEAGAWARRAGDAYLAGYEDAGGIIGDHALLTAFELDKAVYEASYEARNRPSWLPIPVHAIERLTSRSLA
ncbi:MAG TPA: phosphotransferase [Pseudolysinimonas sp.]|nr:phosphotransferase [Pseudolysinimonas sp.]